MTPNEIRNLPAGMDTDVLVAQALGLPETGTIPYGEQGQGEQCYTPYSSDIAAAWRVVEVLRQRFSNFSLYADNGWAAAVWNVGINGEKNVVRGPNADTMPLAVCRLALLAVGGSK